MGLDAFKNCVGLEAITIPRGVTTVERSAFEGCTSLKDVKMDGVTSIGSSAFRDCNGLTEITIPNGVTSIGFSAFYRCFGLTEVTIPDSVEEIGNYAFEGCDSEKAVFYVVKGSYADTWADKSGFRVSYYNSEDDTETSTEVITETQSSTESTTETETQSNAEKTTAATILGGSYGGRHSSGKGVIIGSGDKSKAVSEESTDSEAEKATEAASDEKAVSKEVRIYIGKNVIKIGDREYITDAAPYIQPESSSTLVPLRFAALAISGGSIEDADASSAISWNPNTKTAVLTINGNTLSFTAQSSLMYKNGTPIVMENGVKAEIKNDRMYIPFRALGNALGVSVDWDPNTKSAVYKV